MQVNASGITRSLQDNAAGIEKTIHKIFLLALKAYAQHQNSDGIPLWL
jgi:hypothetical protein